ncbi:MAG: hypothetical protein AB1797_04025 [bacterium]
MRRDIILTFITEFIVLVSGILVYKLAANILGTQGFSEYALSRRTVSLIQPLLLMGLGVGIPRYIAYASASLDNNRSDTYFIAGIITLVVTTLILMLTLNIFDDKFAFLLFGNSNYVYLISPISLMLIGLILHSSCYSFFRGKLNMVSANILQIINMGIVPPIVFLFGKDTKQILLIGGILWIVISVSFLVLILRKSTFKIVNLFLHTKELISYGLQRVPGDFAMAAILSLPAIFTAHISGVKEAGYVSFGISLLNMVGAAFAPIGIILLPKASQLIASKDVNLLKDYVNKILRITLSLTIVGIIIFEILADRIINLYLGRNFFDIVLVVRIIMVASIAYAVYISMRSIIDAYYVKAINIINIILCLLLFLGLSAIAVLFITGYIYIVYCFVIALFLLGILTLIETRKLLVQRQ